MNKVFEGLRPIKREEKIKVGSKDPAKMFCSLCQNEATQFAMYASEGVTVLERYCNTCINKERHIKAH